MEQWLSWPVAHEEYGSPLWPTKDIWYHSEGWKAEQIAQLPQTSTDYKYPGER